MERYIDYRLIEVNTFKEVPKDAINISKLMGLDISIIKNAESYLQKGSEKIGK